MRSLESCTTLELAEELRRRLLLDAGRETAEQAGRRIVLAIATAYQLPEARVMSRRRDERTSQARHQAMQGMLKEGFSSTEVGRFFRRHHSTVLYAAQKLRA